ncbi:MAG: hypothetical protein ACP5FZ_09105 [Fidelibacterota bacterium]
MKIWLKITLAALLCISVLDGQNSRNYQRLKTGIHFDSKVSGGSYTLGELAGIANNFGLDVAIITDHDNMKVSYGIQPFQKFLKFSIQENSVSRYGVEKYLEEIEQIDRIFPDIIFIPGIEAVPYYYWEGSPLYNNLTLRNWHTHLLVFGFDDVEDFKNIPSIANGGLGHATPASGELMKYISANFMHFSIIVLYFILFIIAFFLIIKRSHRRHDIAHAARKRRKKYRFSWKAFLFAALLGYILYSEYPFLPGKYDQYHGDQGAGPFQALIDYVNDNNGLIYYAHPEVSSSLVRSVNIPFLSQSIKIETDAYPHLITETKDYTGFCIFWEGMRTVGRPGGLWDIALDEYCRGYRKKPVYAIGELDFEESNELKLVAATNTFLFAKERSREGVYEALRSGRSYTTRDFVGNELFMDEFALYDIATQRSAFIGETLTLAAAPVAIHIRMRSIHKNPPARSVYIYKNSDLVKTYQMRDSLDEWYVDEAPLPDRMVYYRIYAGKRDYVTLATNPIFVKKY